MMEEVSLGVLPADVIEAYALDFRKPGETPSVRQLRCHVRVWSGAATPDGDEIDQITWCAPSDAASLLATTPWFVDAASYLLGSVAEGSVVIADAVGVI